MLNPIFTGMFSGNVVVASYLTRTRRPVKQNAATPADSLVLPHSVAEYRCCLYRGFRFPLIAATYWDATPKWVRPLHLSLDIISVWKLRT